ncbi:YybS family protein [Fonticella tunisiensis]|uniref:Uncharacterized protein YybS (DUF2232 family) n=1 Tax=Fonticella tunisiensis TaxID=1096341 RepID=A0A4R7K910_9CLOT|nr:YybS family protein [Fonticella tunisiensis]TDT50469.1 uncharacterized protein YybS (DUF2232 family) [Fonticella tunisiensis]
MNGDSNKRAVLETVFLTVISVIFTAVGISVPLFYFVGVFLWPLPAAIIYIKHNAKYSIASIMITAALASTLVHPLSAVEIAVVYGCIGIAIGYSIKNRESAFFTLLLLFAATFISSMMTIKVYSLISGHDIIGDTINSFEQSLNTIKDTYIKYGISKKELDTILKSVYDIEIIKSIIPAILAIYSIIEAFLIYIISNRVFKRLGIDVENVKPFSEFYIPSQLSFAMMAIVILGYIVSSMNYNSSDQYLMNAYLIFSFIFTLDGLAVVSYFLKYRKFPKFIIFIIEAFLIISPLTQIIFYIGLIDYIVNFRRLDVKRIGRNGRL